MYRKTAITILTTAVLDADPIVSSLMGRISEGKDMQALVDYVSLSIRTELDRLAFYGERSAIVLGKFELPEGTEKFWAAGQVVALSASSADMLELSTRVLEQLYDEGRIKYVGDSIRLTK